jgi:tetratricopeptide (TPR) repeat protein
MATSTMRSKAYLYLIGTVSILFIVVAGCRKDNNTAEPDNKPANKQVNSDDHSTKIAELTEAIRLDPKDVKAYFYRGLLLSAKEDFDAAIADLTEAIRLDPTKALLYYYRGLNYSSKGDFDAAIADLTEAIRLDPKNANAYYFRGRAYEVKGEDAKAAEDSAEAEKLGYSSETEAPIEL